MNPKWMEPEPMSKELMFTGPYGIGQPEPNPETDGYHFVGETAQAAGETGDLRYLWRAPKGTLPPQPKSAHVGSIGWGTLTSAMSRQTEGQSARYEPQQTKSPPKRFLSELASQENNGSLPNITERLASGRRMCHTANEVMEFRAPSTIYTSVIPEY